MIDFIENGNFYRKWLQMSEWKRWLLFPFILILGIALCFLTSMILTLPLAYFKTSEYVPFIASGLFFVLTFHTLIFIFAPRGKLILSIITTFLSFITVTLQMFDLSSNLEILMSFIPVVFHMATSVLMYRIHDKNISKNHSGAFIDFYGLIFKITAYCSYILSGLIGLGTAYQGATDLIGKFFTIILFPFVIPISLIITPIYKIVANGNWLPALLIFILPLMAILVFSLGDKISNGSKAIGDE